jgi:hypothetical protein
MKGPIGICGLCGERVAAADLIVHLRVEHDFDEDVETWPDGTPVVVDTTLEPDDFKSGEAAS